MSISHKELMALRRAHLAEQQQGGSQPLSRALPALQRTERHVSPARAPTRAVEV